MAITWTEIENGESLLLARGKINTFNSSVVTMSNTNTDILTDIQTQLDTNTVDIENIESNIIDIEDDIAVNTASIALLEDKAYCSYYLTPELQLTNTYQQITTFNQLLTPVNITMVGGAFTTTTSGVFSWTLERVYTNGDSNPTAPIILSIDVRKNGVSVFNKTAIIGAATAGDEPSTISFTTPFIMSVNAGEVFTFHFKAEENGATPSDTILERVQLTANKIA